MKPFYLILILIAVAFTPCLTGCNKGETKTDATQPLQESFQTADPEVKQAIATVNANLKAGNYAEATKVLSPLVTGRPMTTEQKQAVGLALQQVNQAIAVNPSLDSKEMYELRTKMFQAVHSGPRF